MADGKSKSEKEDIRKNQVPRRTRTVGFEIQHTEKAGGKIGVSRTAQGCSGSRLESTRRKTPVRAEGRCAAETSAAEGCGQPLQQCRF